MTCIDQNEIMQNWSVLNASNDFWMCISTDVFKLYTSNYLYSDSISEVQSYNHTKEVNTEMFSFFQVQMFNSTI